MTARGEALAYFVVHVGEPSGDECRWWPYRRSTTGYGVVSGGYVHRLTAEIWWGDCPEGMEASHLCGRGADGCWAGEHIIWESHSDNLRRRNEHGTDTRGERHPLARLCRDEVIEIRRRYRAGGVTQRALAVEYGVSLAHINGILSGRKWGHLLDVTG